jgi:hypothetical protein
MNITMTFAAATLLIVPLSVLAADDIPVIRSGCSGGVTGGGSGYEIRRDGRISSWRTDSWHSALQSTPIRTDKAAADRIFALFDKAGFARVDYNEPGNMACFLTLESGGKSHTVSWSGKPPQQIQELNDAVTTIVTGKPTQGGLTVMDGVPPPAPKLEPTEKYAAPTGSP